MKVIELTRGKVAVVDDADFSELGQYNWCCTKNGYAIRAKRENGKTTWVYMHREIMNPPEGFQVDHINRNRLDNRRENLRLATRAQNMQNSVKKFDNKSGFKGVHKHSRNNSWIAQISFNGKMTHLGSFKTAEEASLAYNAAALRLHGDFANLN